MLTSYEQPYLDARDNDLLIRARQGRLSNEIDLATAQVYSRLLASPGNRAFLDSVIAGPPASACEGTIAGIVPGAFYRNHKNTGADGAKVISILQNLGIRGVIIPVESFGRLEANAAIIRDWLGRQRSTRIVLITLSKGSADCKMAFRLSAATEWKQVVAWISLSGLVQGTPLIAWLRRQPIRMLGVRFVLWLRRQSFAVAEQLRHGEDAPLASWPKLPPALRLVHVMAFPLRRHLQHPWAARAYERLAPIGPNDGGGVLLEDSIKLPGVVCPLWGVDHYLEPSWDVAPFLRNVILASLLPTLEPRQASPSAIDPMIAPTTRSTK